MGLTAGVVFTVLLIDTYYKVSAIPAVLCIPSEQTEFVKDTDNICGYYQCNRGTFQADPASGNLYKPCAPGTSTTRAAERSIYNLCTTFNAVCTGIVPSVTYSDPESESNQGNNGPVGHHRTTTRRPPTSGQPITSGSGTTRMPTQAPSYTVGSTPTSFSRPVAVFRNAHLDGGRHLLAIRIDQGPVMSVDSRDLCHRACDLNITCTAFDWDERTSACWIHTVFTACGELVPKARCEHVRLVECGASHTVQPHYPEGSTTTMYQPPPTTPTTPPGTEPDRNIKGFSERHMDVHVKHGRIVLTKATEDTCLAYCAHFQSCAAVDFDQNSETCWLHTEDTACGDIIPKTGCIHYKRLTCHKNGLAPMFLSHYQEAHVAGGSPLCDGCTLTQCKHHCLYHPECAGADYNSLEATCYGHLVESVCNEMKRKQGCTHFSRITCLNV